MALLKKFQELSAIEKGTAVLVWFMLGVMAFGLIAGVAGGLTRWTPEASARHDSNTYFCKREAECQAYGEARQACATAGSFETCMSVKLNGAETYLPQFCSNAGQVSMTSQRIPSSTECWLTQYGLE